MRPGDIVRIRPAHVLTHDNTSAVIEKFHTLGSARVRDPRQPVIVLDHDIQNTSASNLAQYARIEAFAQEQGLAFYPKGRGIGHQVMVEEGFVVPGAVVVAADSHANMYGAMSALGTPVARTDAAAIWATGETWWEMPRAVRVELQGKLEHGATGKDVILALTGGARRDEVLNRIVEFRGAGVANLGMSERLTISNMTTEWGALAGMFPADEILFEFLAERARVMQRRGDASPRITEERIEEWRRNTVAADDDAFHICEITIDLARVSPSVAGPNDVKTVRPLSEVAREKIAINKAYLLSCVNARLEDLVQAESVLRGRRVKEGVELYVAAASAEVESDAQRLGVWQSILESGAIPLPSGCGPCIGLGAARFESEKPESRRRIGIFPAAWEIDRRNVISPALPSSPRPLWRDSSPALMKKVAVSRQCASECSKRRRARRTPRARATRISKTSPARSSSCPNTISTRTESTPED